MPDDDGDDHDVMAWLFMRPCAAAISDHIPLPCKSGARAPGYLIRALQLPSMRVNVTSLGR